MLQEEERRYPYTPTVRQPCAECFKFEAAASSEDAFDAAIFALVMAQRADELAGLPQATEACELIDGRIWY